ncbi:hypothetical protein [Luteitalea sp.]
MEFSGFSARLGPDQAPVRSGAATHEVGPAFERHYRIGELATTDMWKLGRETVRLLIKDEVGVIKIRLQRNLLCDLE